ncbi:hypothetical protein V5O48_002177 [Marasmius crinis-equi]|uniref:Uncharacterized protein n=1 Tax=Marasmius crinis-equi TaxID=585013 RepID=A0ABR3FWD4_9AGAR
MLRFRHLQKEAEALVGGLMVTEFLLGRTYPDVEFGLFSRYPNYTSFLAFFVESGYTYKPKSFQPLSINDVSSWVDKQAELNHNFPNERGVIAAFEFIHTSDLYADPESEAYKNKRKIIIVVTKRTPLEPILSLANSMCFLLFY